MEQVPLGTKPSGPIQALSQLQVAYKHVVKIAGGHTPYRSEQNSHLEIKFLARKENYGF